MKRWKVSKGYGWLSFGYLKTIYSLTSPWNKSDLGKMGAQREGNRCCWHRGTGNSSIRKEQQGKNGAKQQILMKRKREENCYYLTANTGSLLRWHLGKIGREFLFTSFSSSWTLPLKLLFVFFFFSSGCILVTSDFTKKKTFPGTTDKMTWNHVFHKIQRTGW